MDAVQLAGMARDDVLYGRCKSCSIFLSQPSLNEPWPFSNRRPVDWISRTGASTKGTFRKSSVNLGSEYRHFIEAGGGV